MMSRRNAAKVSVAALVGGSGLASEAAGAGVTPPTLSPAFDVTVTLGPPLELGMVAAGRRRFVPITGGTVSGRGLSGIVLPGGGDWQTIGPDGTTEIHARYAMQASDGTAIEIDNPGVRVASPEVIARLTAGEDLDPALYYFRTSPHFSLAAGKHDWLRRRTFVGVGVRHPSTVELRVFEVG